MRQYPFTLSVIPNTVKFITTSHRNNIMLDRRLFGIFSGAQITFMVCAAIITPGAVYAVTGTSVFITDPTSGKQAEVASGRLYTYDPITAYANNPANLVVLAGSCKPNTVTKIFTVPAGKVIILKALQMSYVNGTTNFDNSVLFFDNNTGIYLAQFDDNNPIRTFQADLGRRLLHSPRRWVFLSVDGHCRFHGIWILCAVERRSAKLILVLDAERGTLKIVALKANLR